MYRSYSSRAEPFVISLLLSFAVASLEVGAQSPTDRATLASQTAGLPLVGASDNRQAAGQLVNGVLTVRLEVRNGVWYPEGEEGVGLPVAAFAEQGKSLQNPGPLIRVPVGTEVRITLRNSLAKPLTVLGLGAERGTTVDSLLLEADAEREVRFIASTPGTYYYVGKTGRTSVVARHLEDSQLNGAIIVDSATAPASSLDRVFVISWWYVADSTSPTGLARASMVINGRSWPHTERIDVSQGDSLRWRLINLTLLVHPMHLHGFYFRVDGVGDGAKFTTYAADQQRRAVTELLRPANTMLLTWSPNRPGNWIFHCHVAEHMSHLVSVGTERGVPAGAEHAHDDQMTHQMAGLVLGIRVAPRGEPVPTPREYRQLRVLVRSKPNVYGTRPGYAYVIGGSPEEANVNALPQTRRPLVIERGKAVAITVVNQSHEPASVHWHGIELESFPDGVPGWSGAGTSLLPAIPVGDSLVVKFTPPRAGTFMFHSHYNEAQQIASGLYTPIIVVEPGTWPDPEADRILLFSDEGPTTNVLSGPFARALLNGEAAPGPMHFRVGVTYRLRMINIRSGYTMTAKLLDGEVPVEWRLVAKDGADLPGTQATVRPATLTFSPGEIYDVEFTPRQAGDLTLHYETLELPPTIVKPTRVLVRVLSALSENTTSVHSGDQTP